MSILDTLQDRSESKCELCRATDNLDVFKMPPGGDGDFHFHGFQDQDGVALFHILPHSASNPRRD